MTGALVDVDSNSSPKEVEADRANTTAARLVATDPHRRASFGWKWEGQVTAGDSDAGVMDRI